MLRHLLLLIVVSVSIGNYCQAQNSEASTSTLSEEMLRLIDQAKLLRLAENTHWLKLLHYPVDQKHIFGSRKSDVISADFFLATNGSSDPSAELTATIKAFFQPASTDANQHPLCRFPARYTWLREHLDWSATQLPNVNCDQFKEWSLQGKVTAISLIYATGYLSNPASLYGHLLVKFNTADSERTGKLLDPSLSYGAVVPKGENGFLYASKGLFGGYDAGFSHDKFFLHNHNYGETELRDLWEYELHLNANERDQIIAHSWELLHVRFQYFFLSDNCAYRVADLLGIVIEEPLLPNTPWSIPSTVIDQLAHIRRNGQPIVSRVEYLPSRQHRLYEKYETLNTSQKQIVRAIIKNPLTLHEHLATQESTEDKIAELETLFDYYEFRAADSMDKTKYRPQKQQLLIERLRLPALDISWSTTAPAPPHESQPPFRLQTTLLNNSDFGSGVEIGIRPAYYDILALDTGRVPYSSLSMLDLRLLYIDDRVRFRSLNLLTIENMNLSMTDLPGDGGYAWNLRSGFEQQNLSCYQCTIFYAEGGAGKAMPINRKAMLFAMLDGRGQSRAEDSGTLATTARVGAIIDPLRGWRTELSLGNRTYLNSSQKSETIIRWSNRFGYARNWDVRLDYEKHIAEEVRGTATFYW